MEPRDEAAEQGTAGGEAAARGPGDAAHGARRGQSMVEFAVIVPIFILLIMFIIGFGLVFQNKIAMDNAVRSAARYASSHPNTWDTSSSPSSSSIEGRLTHSGSVAQIANDNNITISYATISTNSTASAVTAQCGAYVVTSSTTSGTSTVYSGSYTTYSSVSESACLTQGSLITVGDTIKYKIPVPFVSKIVSLFFPSGVPISSSATMWEDQACSSC